MCQCECDHWLPNDLAYPVLLPSAYTKSAALPSPNLCCTFHAMWLQVTLTKSAMCWQMIYQAPLLCRTLTHRLPERK